MPCVTLQSNLTWHQVSDSLKWVSVLRDPLDQTEIIREAQALRAFDGGLAVYLDHLRTFTMMVDTLRAPAWDPSRGSASHPS